MIKINYLEKYLKYKNKYLELKSQKGGAAAGPSIGESKLRYALGRTQLSLHKFSSPRVLQSLNKIFKLCGLKLLNNLGIKGFTTGLTPQDIESITNFHVAIDSENDLLYISHNNFNKINGLYRYPHITTSTTTKDNEISFHYTISQDKRKLWTSREIVEHLIAKPNKLFTLSFLLICIILQHPYPLKTLYKIAYKYNQTLANPILSNTEEQTILDDVKDDLSDFDIVNILNDNTKPFITIFNDVRRTLILERTPVPAAVAAAVPAVVPAAVPAAVAMQADDVEVSSKIPECWDCTESEICKKCAQN